MLQFIRNLKDYLGNVNKKEKKKLAPNDQALFAREGYYF